MPKGYYCNKKSLHRVYGLGFRCSFFYDNLCFWWIINNPEEVLLENVDLIPEAFDYLQLPFSIKQGMMNLLFDFDGTCFFRL